VRPFPLRFSSSSTYLIAQTLADRHWQVDWSRDIAPLERDIVPGEGEIVPKYNSAILCTQIFPDVVLVVELVWCISSVTYPICSKNRNLSTWLQERLAVKR
jgi:hypothetical protein